MIVIDGDRPWTEELARLVSSLAKLGHEREAFVIIVIIAREYLHSMVEGIDDHQEISMMIIMALLDGANRALDSSIDVVMVRLIEMIAHVCITRTAATKISTDTARDSHDRE